MLLRNHLQSFFPEPRLCEMAEPAAEPAGASALGTDAVEPLVETEGGPASSFGNAPGLAEPMEEQLVATDRKEKKRGTPAPKVYESPHHLLDQLAPPHTKFTLSNMHWRFVVNFLLESEAPEWKLSEWKQKSFTRVFTEDNWVMKLEEVHTFAWRKWKFASKEEEFRLKDDEVQKPGHIPKKILKGLAEVVQNLPERKKYQRPAAK